MSRRIDAIRRGRTRASRGTALLNGVCQLVREQMHSVARLGLESACCEMNVLAGGECLRIHRVRGCVTRSVVMQAHVCEARTHQWLEGTAQGGAHRVTATFEVRARWNDARRRAGGTALYQRLATAFVALIGFTRFPGAATTALL